MKKVLLVGSSGQVAKGLAQALRGRDVLVTGSSPGKGQMPLDLGNPASIRAALEEVKEKWGKESGEIFLCGAMTHVDKCEQEKDLCLRVNAEGPKILATMARDFGYGLTYFSSEYVFGEKEYQGGQVGPFVETDEPAPTSWYGECKLRAEQAIAKIYGQEALIVRTTMVFSWDLEGMNFLMQYFRQLKNPKGIFRVPEDQISTPAYAPFLAEDCVRLRDQKVGGIIHLVGEDLLSRKQLVERVAAEFGFSSAQVQQAFQFVKTKELGQAAKRPLTAGLRSLRLKELGLKPHTLAQAFAHAKDL